MQFRHYFPRTTFSSDVKAAIFEFVGTTVFLLLAFGGTQGSNEVDGSQLERTLYIATAFGLSLLVSAWFFFRATGGLFNPDVSLALLLIGAIGPVRFILYCIAQLTGAIAAAGIVLALTPGAVTYKYVPGWAFRCLLSESCGLTHHVCQIACLFSTVPAANINLAQGVFIEMFITAALCLAVLMLAAEKHIATPFAPVGVLCLTLHNSIFCLLSTMADQSDIGRYRSHSLRMPPVSSGVIHLTPTVRFGTPWHANMLADCSVFHLHSATYPTDALTLVCAMAVAFPIFGTRLVSAGSRCPTRVLA